MIGRFTARRCCLRFICKALPSADIAPKRNAATVSITCWASDSAGSADRAL
jgi:hypothetical protein